MAVAQAARSDSFKYFVGDVSDLHGAGPQSVAAHQLAPRAVLQVTPAAADRMQWFPSLGRDALLGHTGIVLPCRFSLTLWQDGQTHPKVSDLLFIRDNTEANQVYYDIYEPTLSEFKEAAGTNMKHWSGISLNGFTMTEFPAAV